MTATPHSVSQPLNLRSMIRSAPRPGFDFVAAVDLVLIVLFFALNGSRFIFAPGAEVDLVETRHPELGGPEATVVLTVGRNGILFFESQKIAGAELEAKLAAYVADHNGAGTLLLKLDRSLDLETVFELMDAARSAGFARVQLAAEASAEGSAGGSR